MDGDYEELTDCESWLQSRPSLDFTLCSVEIHSCAILGLLTTLVMWYFLPAASWFVSVVVFLFLVSQLSLHCLNDPSLFFFLSLNKEILPHLPADQGLETHCLRCFQSLLSLTLFVRILAKCLRRQKNHRHIIWEKILCSSRD